jgi:hypothetical protein
VWQSHRFRNRGSKCLSTHDAHYATTYLCCFRNHPCSYSGIHDVHYAADRQPRGAMLLWRQARATASAAKIKVQDRQARNQNVGPTYKFTTSREVGPRATVGTQ